MSKTTGKSWVEEKYKNRGFFVRVWYWVINIGIDENTSFFDRKRTRLLNGILFISIIAYICNSANFIGHPISELETVVGLAVSFGIFFLTARKKYGAACHIFNIWNVVAYTAMSIASAGKDATEMYLIPSCAVAMLFFRKTSTIIAYFAANFACFWIARYCYTIIAPINSFPEMKNVAVSNHVLMFVILFLIIYYFKAENASQEKLLEVRNDNLNNEKEKSDKLLLNILPVETADELKATGSAQARKYDHVTVMFTDFKNFTLVSENMTPEEIVKEINYCYSAFDKILKKHGVEKIKTIGDGYMAAGGLPVKNQTNHFDTINAALEIRDFLEKEKGERIKENKIFFEARIGVHTGPVIAGVVGLDKFAYDIWGDTVNTASRLESSGEPGRINISGSTYELVKNDFTCTYRGKMQAKNKGEVDMYFVM